jgi:hypothetical protein
LNYFSVLNTSNSSLSPPNVFFSDSSVDPDTRDRISNAAASTVPFAVAAPRALYHSLRSLHVATIPDCAAACCRLPLKMSSSRGQRCRSSSLRFKMETEALAALRSLDADACPRASSALSNASDHVLPGTIKLTEETLFRLAHLLKSGCSIQLACDEV